LKKLPIPTKFKMAINLGTARTLGLTELPALVTGVD
jgi:hypothetical protein